jgi:hypothetical protein
MAQDYILPRLRQSDLSDEELLAEVDEVLRTMPRKEDLRLETDDTLGWIGRAGAVISLWDRVKGHSFDLSINRIHIAGVIPLIRPLHQARADLILRTERRSSQVVSGNMPFHYFDEIRKIIEMATADILFVDPYLDAEFVSRYLPQIKDGVRIRLLASHQKINTLQPAAQMYQTQNAITLELRTSPDFHDRFVFIDEISCYQSGASFKDGAKKMPTTITQITDAFAAMYQTYSEIWDRGTVVL